MDESEFWDKVILWGKAKTPNLPPNLDEWIDENLKDTLHICLPHIRYLQISGSKNGFTGETFHILCDNILGIVVVKINSTNEILGGYNPLIWKVGSHEDATTADDFIFSLKNGNLNESILSRVAQQSNAIRYAAISKGPWFINLDFGMGYGYNSKI
ncbi:hypothetical protein C2G38_2258162 [Gigaspora rosea]|uniref:TLDc domain-containing protein n=1 Tax=Gigaspora rosea TaxID=44941 RepID=A0A397VZA6_9GLOM|nr:hypothetical protein C2G38_2258162 [Gigaspora rosea]